MNTDAPSENVTPPIVELIDVTKSYDEAGRTHCVLDHITARFPRGQFVVLLGRSGSGKTTLLNLVAGIDAPTSGQVVVAGAPISKMSDRDRTLFRRRHIGFVYQFFNLVSTLTVAENVALPLELVGRNSHGQDRALELLHKVGLGGRGDTFPDRLSGGEQQRVAIARALAIEPDLVLADEPTGNLDADTGAQVLELLVSLTRGLGHSLLMATHSRTVAAQADTVFRVDDGHLVPVEPDRLAEIVD